MLAAAPPDRERFPSLFHLALEILSSNRDLPPLLSEHVRMVVAQALDIAADPASVTAATLAEFIQLALAVRSSEQLRLAIEPAQTTQIDAARANEILSAERNFASAN